MLDLGEGWRQNYSTGSLIKIFANIFHHLKAACSQQLDNTNSDNINILLYQSRNFEVNFKLVELRHTQDIKVLCLNHFCMCQIFECKGTLLLSAQRGLHS